jgi:hypothetical protein
MTPEASVRAIIIAILPSPAQRGIAHLLRHALSAALGCAHLLVNHQQLTDTCQLPRVLQGGGGREAAAAAGW